MSLDLKDDYIAYKGKELIYYDSFDGVNINWGSVQYTLNDIPIESVFILDGDHTYTIEATVDSLLIKGFCLALMFAHNYGFRSNIDLGIYDSLWKNYNSNISSGNYNIYEVGIAATNDIESLESSVYEDYVVANNKKYTLYSTIDWKSVIGCTSDFEDGNAELDSEILMALALLEARSLGLNEGKPR